MKFSVILSLVLARLATGRQAGGVTLPFNLLLGLPLCYQAARWLAG